MLMGEVKEMMKPTKQESVLVLETRSIARSIAYDAVDKAIE